MSELRQIYDDLRTLKAELWSAAEQRLRAEFGLPLTDLEVMAAIGRIEACQLDDIAAELAMSIGTATALVNRIEAQGYCRRPGPADGGGPALELTSKGQSLVTDAGLALDDELEGRLRIAAPPRMLDEFAATLHRLASIELCSTL